MERFSTVHLRLLICCMTLIAGFYFFAGSAHAQKAAPLAAACYGSGCNHLDPYQEGCQYGDATHGSAYVATSYHYQSGSWNFIIDNWYSPKCAANWNVTTFYNSYIEFVEIKNANGDFDCYPNIPGSHYCDPSAAYITSSPAWTNMVNGTVKATACVIPQHAYNEICGSPA